MNRGRSCWGERGQESQSWRTKEANGRCPRCPGKKGSNSSLREINKHHCEMFGIDCISEILHYGIYSRVSQGFQGISLKVKYCEISGFSLKIHLYIIFNICQQANNINTSLSNLTLEVLHQWKFLSFKIRNILFPIGREINVIQTNPVKISSFQYGLEHIVSHPM